MTISFDLARRNLEPEIMDQPGLAVSRHEAALRGLARINWVSASDAILWPPIRRLAVLPRERPLRVLDVACGGGDVVIRLYRRARRAGLPIVFTGMDVSGTAVDFARRQAQASAASIDFIQGDAIHAPLPPDHDVVMCSLFLHHLDVETAKKLLRRMADAARAQILVNDLIRSRIGFLLAYIGTRILSRCDVVHADGPQSVCAAFTMAEARELAACTGLVNATLSWHWPFRFLLQWSRP